MSAPPRRRCFNDTAVPAGQVAYIPVWATGTEEVLGINLYVQVDTGGNAPPVITGIVLDDPGLAWGGRVCPPFVLANDARTWLGQTTVETLEDGLQLTSIPVAVGYVVLDTTGTVPGQSFQLRLGGIEPGIFPPAGAFSDLTVPGTVRDGTITIVPEPASLFLWVAGAFFLRRRSATVSTLRRCPTMKAGLAPSRSAGV